MVCNSKCWDCKHDSLELKILVPPNSSIQHYVRSTGTLCSDIVAIIKEKQERYTIWYRSFNELKRVSFKMIHTCKFSFNIQKNNSCIRHELKCEQNHISNITYSKAYAPELCKIILPKIASPLALSRIANKSITT